MKINYINVINIGYKDSVSIDKIIKFLNNELPKKKKIIMKNKSRTTRLNLSRLKKITNKTFKLEQGIKLLLRSNDK